MDPGSGSWKIIRILADPDQDPQHWLKIQQKLFAAEQNGEKKNGRKKKCFFYMFKRSLVTLFALVTLAAPTVITHIPNHKS
jgi:hypothetical protein